MKSRLQRKKMPYFWSSLPKIEIFANFSRAKQGFSPEICYLKLRFCSLKSHDCADPMTQIEKFTIYRKKILSVVRKFNLSRRGRRIQDGRTSGGCEYWMQHNKRGKDELFSCALLITVAPHVVRSWFLTTP